MNGFAIQRSFGLTTRTVSGPRKGTDEGYGWGRTCSTESCDNTLHHRNPLTTCEACQVRERDELRNQPRLAATAEWPGAKE